MGRAVATPEFVDELARHGADANRGRPCSSNGRAPAAPRREPLSAAQAIVRMFMEIDIRDVLPTIHLPTLVLAMPMGRDEAQFIADRIPQARLLDVPGPDYFIKLLGDDVYDEIEKFVRGLDVESVSPDTVLATVIFTDIADSDAERVWRSVTARGQSSSPNITPSSAASWTSSAVPRSTPPGTASSPASRGRSRDSLWPRDHRLGAVAWSGRARRAAQRRVRAGRRETRRARRQHRRASRGRRRDRGSAGHEHRQGSRRGVPRSSSPAAGSRPWKVSLGSGTSSP